MQYERLLNRRQVRDLVGLSYAQIDRLEMQGRFPKRHVLLTDINGRPTRVTWRESEVLAWINHRCPPSS